jgi:5-methyltetrahydropteroyltriglutamate--homocysteine methyltransferase
MIMYLLLMQLDQLVLEYATPRAGDLDVWARFPKAREIGLGVVNPRSDDVESVESIVAKVNEALDYFAPEQICLNRTAAAFAERPMGNRNGGQAGGDRQAARELRKAPVGAGTNPRPLPSRRGPCQDVSWPLDRRVGPAQELKSGD